MGYFYVADRRAIYIAASVMVPSREGLMKPLFRYRRAEAALPAQNAAAITLTQRNDYVIAITSDR
jgi:hypothetical protein